MPAYRVYTKQRLSRINTVYLSEYSHHIEIADVKMANRCIKKMYESLDAAGPQVGDVIHYTTREGTYYPHAHIDDIHDGIVSVCLAPFDPFVQLEDGKVHMNSVSGGPWVEIPENEMKKSGVETKRFRFFGSAGVCANGAIQFEGYANCWEYKEADLLFGEFSTKEYTRTVYRKFGVQWHCETTDPDNGTHAPNTNDFFKWMKELKGVQFGDFAKDDTVTIFTYKERDPLVSFDFWKGLKLPLSTRQINGNTQVDVKLYTNDRQKLVVAYRYTNN